MALLIGLGIGFLVIAGFIAYWMIMLTLIILGAVFVFWAFVFSYFFNDPYIGGICSVFATGLSLWAYGAYSNKQKPGGGSS
jgi:hypothetical protein